MANHLTPTELARETGLERRDVISKCMELGVPIFQGRIDKTLFLASLGMRHAREVAARDIGADVMVVSRAMEAGTGGGRGNE